MNKKRNGLLIFLVAFIIVAAMFAMSVVKNNQYNANIYNRTFTGDSLLSVRIWMRPMPV